MKVQLWYHRTGDGKDMWAIDDGSKAVKLAAHVLVFAPCQTVKDGSAHKLEFRGDVKVLWAHTPTGIAGIMSDVGRVLSGFAHEGPGPVAAIVPASGGTF